MAAFAHYLSANPFVAAGLGILAVLLVHNLLRQQVRVALSLWLLIVVVAFYVWIQATSPGATRLDDGPPALPDLTGGEVEVLPPPAAD